MIMVETDDPLSSADEPGMTELTSARHTMLVLRWVISPLTLFHSTEGSSLFASSLPVVHAKSQSA